MKRLVFLSFPISVVIVDSQGQGGQSWPWDTTRTFCHSASVLCAKPSR